MKPVINYDDYRRGRVINKHLEGFWFDMDQFENLIDAWSTQEEVITMLQSSREELDKFCKICYNRNFAETYTILINISRMFMRKSYDGLAKAGNATALNIVAKNFSGYGDSGENNNVNITFKNDLK